MSARLTFEAPADLSIGRIQVIGPNGQTIHDWVATPETRVTKPLRVLPGLYTAEISPAGLDPQRFHFQVEDGQETVIVSPAYGALVSAGGGSAMLGPHANYEFPRVEPSAPPRINNARQVEVNADRRRFSVGLSRERRSARDRFEPFRGRALPSLDGNALAINIEPEEAEHLKDSGRVRLSVSIESLRTERLLLPMYRGGTSVRFVPSPLTAADVTMEVIPNDPSVRALLRCLHAGTISDARAVNETLFPTQKLELELGRFPPDPWEAILASLLFIRFPDVFAPLSLGSANNLLNHTSWAFDAHVILAKAALDQQSGSNGFTEDGIELVVRSLRNAQSWGSPYYVYSNRLFAEIIASLRILSEPDSGVKLSAIIRNSIASISKRWQREMPLQGSAGAAFTWLSRDPAPLKEPGVLTPKRNTNGLLRGRDSTIVFRGALSGSKIEFDTLGQMKSRASSKSIGDSFNYKNILPKEESPAPSWESGAPIGAPSLSRRAGPEDDPNNGRFGSAASVGGYELKSWFEKARGGTVEVDLVITAGPEVPLELGDVAWFCLHPTFSPQWVSVMFRGRRAKLTVRAWGGFTVGAWLPRTNVELECDISKQPGAPSFIREL